MYIATREQMLKIEKLAETYGLSQAVLMENAGKAAAQAISALVPQSTETVILCGTGNNGGDGLIVASELAVKGYSLTVIMTDTMPATELARAVFERMRHIPVIFLAEEPYRAAAAVSAAGIVVDAVFGIGFHGALPSAIAKLFALVQPTQRRFSLDIPSGVCCDTGSVETTCFPAEYTLTFTARKRAMQLHPAVCGTVQVLPIGVPDAAITAVLSENILSEQDIAPCFIPRPSDSHKGTFGHLLAVCGSKGMAGAAILSAKAALRSGVGLLTIALPESIYPIVASAVPEAVFLPLPETKAGTLSAMALAPLLSAIKHKDALLIGCGLGTGNEIQTVVCQLLQHADCPVILDADGINAVVRHIHILETTHAPLILTPHPGEMARMQGTTIPAVQADRTQVATAFAKAYGVTLVLKGYHTIIATPQTFFENHNGNPGMATGGSGDVLAGMIAAFAAQKMSPIDAAKCGVYLHGKAGDLAAKRLSQQSMLPSDMIEELGGLFLHFEK